MLIKNRNKTSPIKKVIKILPEFLGAIIWVYMISLVKDIEVPTVLVEESLSPEAGLFDFEKKTHGPRQKW